MFKLCNEYGDIPYDGFRVYGSSRPMPEFIEAAQEFGDIFKRQGWVWEDEPGWQNLVSLPVNGARGALRVGWNPTMIGRNMPKSMICCNPSTVGLGPNETLALLRWVLMWPEGEPMDELATKLDFEGTVDEIDSCLYLPGVRADNVQYMGQTHYHGSRKGNQLRPYDKGREMDREPDQHVRLEMTEHFKNNANPKQRRRRPTVEEFLRGDLVDQNGLRLVKVVNLAAVGIPALTDLATKVGLSEAIRLGLRERDGKNGRILAPSMAIVRRLVNANSKQGVLLGIYKEQAIPWHAQFDLTSADALTVVWNERLGLQISPRGTSAAACPV